MEEFHRPYPNQRSANWLRNTAHRVEERDVTNNALKLFGPQRRQHCQGRKRNRIVSQSPPQDQRFLGLYDGSLDTNKSAVP